MLMGGILLAALGLLGYGVERWRWGRNPRVTRTEILMVMLIPAGAVIAVVGLVLKVAG